MKLLSFKILEMLKLVGIYSLIESIQKILSNLAQ